MSLNGPAVRLASLGAVWQQGVIPQEQTTRWTGGPDCEKTEHHIMFRTRYAQIMQKLEKQFLGRLGQEPYEFVTMDIAGNN